jgi:hypothetical protein
MSDQGQQGQNDQWLRKVSLIVADSSGAGLDLSELRIHFKISQSDFETPNSAEIRVFNLSQDTAQKIRKEYTSVTLQAGYQSGAFGIIFQGTIKQVRIGRQDQTDTYLDIFASDSDEVYNFGTINQSITAGTSPNDQIDQIAKAIGAQKGTIQFNTGLQDNIRGKVLYGMGRIQLRTLARTGLASWSLQNGKITMVPLTGYAKGEAVVINSQTGMVGLPQQTEDGVTVQCLLNPKIVIGTQVQLNEGTVQRAQVSLNLSSVNQTEAAFPPVPTDGFYYAMVVEHEGDTRDNEYYSTLTCLTVDKTAPAGNSVQSAG